jgi:CarboxypepD_reg-like domain/TonB-dependent Receptor Plug Domain
MNLKSLFFPSFIIFFFLVLLIPGSFGQNATIRGFVYESATGEPVIFTNVYLYKTSMGSATDINGYFAITKIPAGQYELMVTYMGFDTLRIPVILKANDLISKKLYLTKSAFQLGEINVSAARQDKKVETQTSIIKISPREIDQIPMIGGTPDLAQYLQVLPGVIFTGDQGGQLYIRGGPPIQNRVLLDGMTVYNPFHSIGLFSVFDVDILKSIDVYTGGFNAEYGGRISSIMDITTRDGNKMRYSGKLDASTFGAKLLLEGPIARAKDDDSPSASFVFSIKDCYLKESSKVFYKYIDPNGLPYNYLDLYGKISVNAPNGSKVSFYGFSFNDNVQYQDSLLPDFKWSSYGGGANFIVIPGKSTVLLEGNLAYSYYKISTQAQNQPPKSSSIGEFIFGLHFTYFFAKNALKYGIEVNGGATTFDFFNSVNRKIDYSLNNTNLTFYGKYKWSIGKFILEPGLRLEFYASLSELSLEPRFSAKYNVSNNFRLKMAAGMYSQNLISTTYDQDVVNLFYGFLYGPDNLPSEFNGKPVTYKLQKCDQVVFGFELDLSKNIFLNVEGYYKYYPQLTTLNRNKLYDDNAANKDKPDYLKKDFIIEKGDAEGIDLSIKYNTQRINLMGSYSLGFIHRNDGRSTYVPPYDRRHTLNLTATYTFGRKLSWEVDARWTYGSGFPFTQTQGFYELIKVVNMGTDYTKQNGDLGIVYADYDKGRLPYYSRLDFSLKKRFLIGRNAKLEINFSITNLTNQQNIFYFDRIHYVRVDQLPFMPSLGLSFSF